MYQSTVSSSITRKAKSECVINVGYCWLFKIRIIALRTFADDSQEKEMIYSIA